jgi:hypothetical protein
MNSDTDKNDILDPSPDATLLIYLGAINIYWAMVEAHVSAALFSLLELDDLEFTILLGRLEIVPKLKKLEQILRHRKNEEKEKFVTELIKCVDKLRPDRNALYQGKSNRGEYAFALMADVLFEEDSEAAKKMRVFTVDTLKDHVGETIDLLPKIHAAFDSPKMLKLYDGPFRVPKGFQVDPLPAIREETPKSQPQSFQKQ